MSRKIRARRHRRRTPIGAPPGTLTADPASLPSTVSIIAYDETRIEEPSPSIGRIGELRDDFAVVWINVNGLADVDLISTLGKAFSLHPLALEDVINIHQRPKVEEYEDHLFIVTRMPADDGRAETEQISIFLGEGYVVTFQERAGDVFDPVRTRIRNPRSRFRQNKADYLAYALLDASIDNFFPVLERRGEELERLEDQVVTGADAEMIEDVHEMKRDLLDLRRTIWPQREMLNSLIRSETRFITEPTKLFLRDCYDHTIQLMDMVEHDREIALGLIDVYLSTMSNRMNEIMKVLTVFATIFMPLSFITGLYGMNFDTSESRWNMPELGWEYGYPAVVLFMIGVALVLIVYFRRRGWLGADT